LPRNSLSLRNYRFAIFLFPLFALIAILAASGHAQKVSASLGGTVKDPNQAVVPGAIVRITNTGTSQTITTQTSAAGLFEFPDLAPGPYTITADAPGFERLVRTGLVLEVDQSAAVDLTLTVGASTQTVEVSGAAPLLSTQNAEVGQVIENKSIVDLPLNQRNTFSLILLVPGVSGAVGTSYNALQFNVNGGRAGTSEILLDGIPSAPPTDAYNIVGIFPSVDATQEFKVMTSSYSAQFGLSGSGIINVVYKSGTNQFHGGAYEFLRNSKMDANTFFNDRSGLALPHLTRSQFGFDIGGPVIIPKLFNGRNKFFFFGDYEGLREQTATTLLTTVPTAAEKAGDFTADTNASGQQIKIYDPLTTQAASPYLRNQLSCNGVPNTVCSSRFDPVGAAVLKYFPAPNVTGSNGTQVNNYAASGSTPYDIDQGDVKLDADITDRQHVGFRYSVRNPSSGTARLLPAALAIAQNSAVTTVPAVAGEFSYAFTRSPKDLYEFRYGIDHAYLRVKTISNGFDPGQLGFPSYLASAALADEANSLTFPGFEMTGYYSLGTGSQLSNGQLGIMSQTWMLANTRVFARQTVVYGAEFRALTNNAGQVGRAVGDFSFGTAVTAGPNAQAASSTTGDSVASLLLGLGSGGTVTHNFKIINAISHYFAGFAQDDWRVSDRVTLNGGLRYEVYFPRTERENRMTWWNPAAVSPITLSGVPLRGGLEYAGAGGNPRSQSEAAFTNFAPRIGLAWHPFGNVAVQGGFGLFYSVNASEAAATVDPTGYRTDTTYYGTQGNSGIFPENYISNPLPGGSFIPVTGNTLGLATVTGGGVASPQRISKTPYSENYNLGIQYQLPRNWLIDVRYVGSHGLQLLFTPYVNQLPDSYLSMGSGLLNTVPNPFNTALIQDSGPITSATVQERYLLAPFPQFTGVQLVNANGAISHYDSLQIRVVKQFSRNLTLLGSYTGSKALDDAAVQNSNETPSGQPTVTYQDASIPLFQDSYGLSTIDVSKNLVTSFVYSLPFGRGQHFGTGWNRLVDAVLGGYQVSGIFTAHTGNPLAFSATNVANIFNPGERPNWNGQNARLSGKIENRLQKYFDTADFSQPATYTFGNMSGTSGYLRTPGYRNLDVTLKKSFDLYRESKLELHAEGFNAFNTPQFGAPNTSVTSSSFGIISSQMNSPRQIQLAAKFLF
jgi:hypothetical protein